jgi:phosphomannomutase
LSYEKLRLEAESWCKADPDPETREEIESLLANDAYPELNERFSGRLEFGTAGLRGLMGAGPNRMNRAVVRATSAGIARYLKSMAPQSLQQGVVVGRDARRMSREFAEDAAGVFVGEGIPVWFFEHPVPTPLLAFSTLHLGASAGVMVTASHNPAAYNGYKLYWANGAQIAPPHDRKISDEILRIAGSDRPSPVVPTGAPQAGQWSLVGDEVGEAYLTQCIAQRRHPEVPNRLRVVYTPMHGVGGPWVSQLMQRAGVTDFLVVAQQQQPDPTFPSLPFPNPEEPGALDLSLELAQKVGADLVLANDPDADRLAVAARNAHKILRVLTGDELGTLLGHYVLTQSRFSMRPLVLSTIVSSGQLGEIARALGALYEQTLTGFKWIANRALELEGGGEVQFAFGYEEALGYSIGAHVRDKDGVGAALAVTDMAGWCASQGVTLIEYLERLQRDYGLYVSRQKSFTFPGSQGAKVIDQIMEGFRERSPDRIAGLQVEGIQDYRHPQTHPRPPSSDTLPTANVLAYQLAQSGRITLRPSGTEPKIKHYFEVKECVTTGETVDEARERAIQKLNRIEEAFIEAARQRGQPR